MTFQRTLMRVVIAGALLGCAVPGCDDSNDNAKPGDTAGSSAAGKGGKGGSSGSKAGSGGAGGKAGSSASAGKGGSSGAAGAAGKGGSGDDNDAGMSMDECKGVTDCFCGAPTKNEDFLNHCTEATCNPFDNSKLTKFKDGKLPAIP